VLCVRTLVKSKLGLAFKAIKGDPIWAASLGINLLKYRVINVTISCFLLGLLGGFYAHYFGFLTPDALSINITMQVVAMSLIGGSGTLWGGFVGSALVTILLEIVRIVFAQNITLSSGRFIIFGILIVIVVLFFREGIAGGIKRIMGALTKTRAHLTSSSNK
jgi:branched-chain amino acid transport system permease protein